MTTEMIKAISAVTKLHDVDLKFSDILDISDYETSVCLVCRNDSEMYAFRINAYYYADTKTINMSISELPDSPYSCDTINAIYDVSSDDIHIRNIVSE